MKRWAFAILLFVLLGAIVNIAVAWGCVAFVPLSHDRSGLSSLDFGYKWAIERWSGFGARRLWSHTWCGMSDRVMNDVSAERLVVPWSRIRRPEPVRADSYRGETIVDGIRISVAVNQQMIDDARGLPCLSLRCGWGTPALVTANPPSCWIGSCDWGIELTTPDPDPTSGAALPLRPIWPGFLINTLFYALVLWLLICGPLVLRRLICRTRHRCPMGDSDLRGKLRRVF